MFERAERVRLVSRTAVPDTPKPKPARRDGVIRRSYASGRSTTCWNVKPTRWRRGWLRCCVERRGRTTVSILSKRVESGSSRWLPVRRTRPVPRRARIQRQHDGSASGPDGGDLDPKMKRGIGRRRVVGPSMARCGLDWSVRWGLTFRVRLHTTARAAAEVGAVAFTVGSDIHFATRRIPSRPVRWPTLARPRAGTCRGTVRRTGCATQDRPQRAEGHLPRVVGSRSTAAPAEEPHSVDGDGSLRCRVLPRPRRVGDHHPPVLRVLSNRYRGGVVTPGGWLKADEDTFVDDFKQQSEAAWSDKYSFACTKPGYTELRADVVINVVRELDPTKAHFHHRIQKNKGMITGIGREQNDDPTKINVGNFAEQDAPVWPHDSKSTSVGIASHDVERLQDLAIAHHVNPIKFTNGSRAQIEPASRQNLDAFIAAVLRTERPGSVPVPLVATGKSNKREAAERGNAAKTARTSSRPTSTRRRSGTSRARHVCSTTSSAPRRRCTRARSRS